MVTHRCSIDHTGPLPAARCDCGWLHWLSTRSACIDAIDAHLHDADPWAPTVVTMTAGGYVWEHEQ